MGGACQSDGRFGLKRLVNQASPARMIDKTLAHMIDETLRGRENLPLLADKNA